MRAGTYSLTICGLVFEIAYEFYEEVPSAYFEDRGEAAWADIINVKINGAEATTFFEDCITEPIKEYIIHRVIQSEDDDVVGAP